VELDARALLRPGIALFGVWFAERVNLDALRIAYGDLAALAVSLDEAASGRPTACAGWTVRDLVFPPARRRAACAGRSGDAGTGPADRNATTYWAESPAAPDAESRGIRASRTMASQWRPGLPDGQLRQTAAALLTLAVRAQPDDLVATQGHALAWRTCSPRS
jgi:hypothetical protein